MARATTQVDPEEDEEEAPRGWTGLEEDANEDDPLAEPLPTMLKFAATSRAKPVTTSGTGNVGCSCVNGTVRVAEALSLRS